MFRCVYNWYWHLLICWRCLWRILIGRILILLIGWKDPAAFLLVENYLDVSWLAEKTLLHSYWSKITLTSPDLLKMPLTNSYWSNINSPDWLKRPCCILIGRKLPWRLLICWKCLWQTLRRLPRWPPFLAHGYLHNWKKWFIFYLIISLSYYLDWIKCSNCWR